MKPTKILPYILSLTLLFFASCVKDELNQFPQEQEEQPDPNVNTIEELKVPDQFDFSTHKEVEISISDVAPYARYSIQSKDENLFKGFIVDNQLIATIRVATATEELTLLRSADSKQETFTVSISGEQLLFEYTD